MTTSFKDTFTNPSVPGKDAGIPAMAEMENYVHGCVAEYVWVDGKGGTRSKARTLTASPLNADDAPIWAFNGFCCEQAYQHESDIYLVPRAIFHDPFRGGANVMILCEAVTPAMKPADGNYRSLCAETMDSYAAAEPWFGMEQEYTCMAAGKMTEFDIVSALQNADGSAPSVPGGTFYGAAGAENVPKDMRNMMDDHYAACLDSGVKICGANLEAAPGQGEFQIGPCRGIDIGDHMVMARHLLQMCADKYGLCVSYAPKPVRGQAGNGCHANFSTKETRDYGGLAVIERICRAYGRRSKEHMSAYGEGNEDRLTGEDQTSKAGSFSYAVSSRNVAVRVPRNCGMTGRGYFEDRRPAGNCDPYRTCGIMLETAGQSLNTHV